MDCRTIPLSAIPHTSRLFRDYISGATEAMEIFPHHFRNPKSFEFAAQQVDYPEKQRAAVVGMLREQNQRWGISEQRERNLSRLAKPGCLAVVTGQQVGLFTGPAFSIYKALTAARLAQELTSQGIEAVPIFWLATEDHDLEEVNHTSVQDREGKPRTVRYSGKPEVADSPAGLLPLLAGIHSALDELRESLPEGPLTQQVVDWLGPAYHPGETLGGAFGYAMAYLLGPYGVLTVDPLDARVHRLAGRVLEHASRHAAEVRTDLLRRNEHLASIGYHAQVRVSENSTLLFAYESGKRSILHSSGADFVSSTDTNYTSAELCRLAEQSPEALSPTALLRPVMQDALFPTVAYVAGPAEIAYLAQSAPVYERILGRMPVVVPRASITVAEPPIQRLMTKYHLTFEDVFAGRQHLREKMAARFFSEDLTRRFQQATESVEFQMAGIQEALQKLDPTLADAAKHSVQKMLYQLGSLERKAAAAVQHKTDQVERDATKLENALYPEKIMQERIYSGASLLARHGMQFVEQLFRAIPPLPVDHQILFAE